MEDERKCPCDAMMEAQAALRRHDERLGAGTTNFALINQSLIAIEKDVAEVKKDVKEMVMKPAKRWDKIVEYVLLAAIAFMLAKAGLA